MTSFVLVLLEVQVMRDNMVLIRTGEDDIHEEFTPSFFLNAERSFLDHCKLIASAFRYYRYSQLATFQNIVSPPQSCIQPNPHTYSKESGANLP